MLLEGSPADRRSMPYGAGGETGGGPLHVRFLTRSPVLKVKYNNSRPNCKMHAVVATATLDAHAAPRNSRRYARQCS